MKRLFVLALFCFSGTFSLLIFAQEKKEIFVEQIEFKLDRVSQNSLENEYFMTLKFNKGTSYKFRVMNNIENLPGKAVFQVLDQNSPVLTNALNEKYFENINFVCNKTAFYDILVKYQDGKPGYSIIDIFMLQ
jgi:hypothetical protein